MVLFGKAIEGKMYHRGYISQAIFSYCIFLCNAKTKSLLHNYGHINIVRSSQQGSFCKVKVQLALQIM